MGVENFGYQTIGSAGGSSLTNSITGSKYNCPIGARLQSMWVYLTSYVSGSKVKCAIYDSSLNIVAETEEISTGLTVGAWNPFDVESQVDITAGDYWLVAWASGTAAMPYDDGDTNQGAIDSDTYGDGIWPDPLSPTYYDRKYSIYCRYEERGGPPRRGNILNPRPMRGPF